MSHPHSILHYSFLDIYYNMNHQGSQQRALRRTTRRSRGVIASHEENNENGTEEQPIQQDLVQDQTFYQDFECAICLDILSNPYIIPECCHRFCCDCIHKSIKAGNKECPTCRVHIVSKRSLRRDELFGKMLHRLLKVESEVKVLTLKENATTRLPLENNETYSYGEEHEHGPNEKEKCKNEPCNKEKTSKSKKRKGNDDATHGHDAKRPKSKTYIERFEHRLKDLRLFKKKHGHCNVPKRYKDDPSLGKWAGSMRYAYNQIQLGLKPQHCLTQARIEKLEEIGFQWKIRNNSFDRNLAKLQKFKVKHGHCDVPALYEDDPSLGRWAGRMREAYEKIQLGKKTKTNLTESMIEKLVETGFQWEIKNNSFDRNLAKLQKFKREARSL